MSIRSLRYPIVAGGAIVACTALFAWSGAGAFTSTVDIRVEHNLIDDPTNQPRVLEVTGVTPGPGFELTIADEIANPSGWGGNVMVDIDPDTHQIIVEVEDQNCYDVVTVQITSDEIGGVATVSDGIFDTGQGVVLSTSVSGGVTTLSWAGTDCPDLAVEGSQSVFTYTDAVPTSSTSSTTSTTTVAPTTQAPVAAAATVTPAFTG
jgi:hypothetical protein